MLRAIKGLDRWVVIEMKDAAWRRLAVAVRHLLVDAAARAGTVLGQLRRPRRAGTLSMPLVPGPGLAARSAGLDRDVVTLHG